MPSNTPTSFFDTPERTPPSIRNKQIAALEAAPLVGALLEAVGSPAALINADREVVMGNEHLAVFAGVPRARLVGRRIGEILGCAHAYEPPGGCGTTEACAWCGAAQALRDSRLQHRTISSECRITIVTDQANDTINAGLTCTPLEVAAVPVIMVVLRDTSDAQRRHVLERMFFHDALNAAGGLRGLMEVWPDLSPEEAAGLAPTASRLAQQLVQEIEAHRDLTAAENGSLTVSLGPVAPDALLEGLRVLFSAHEVAEGKRIAVHITPVAQTVTTDVVLLRRVLGNLLKNALEASAPGETVTIRHDAHGSATTFAVHNPGVMSEAARIQIFQRAFTTKGQGRGLGTYGARLIAERHLGATLRFDSDPSTGTTFTLTLPPRP
jgi:nitrogen-specific signal transduction histidine kinase